jgi:secondary thiamine-phosphate synthase enzyme
MTTAAPLSQAATTLDIETRGKEFIDITSRTAGWLANVRAGDGLLTVLVRHTSASLVIQENADPDVQTDLLDSLDRLAPDDAGYRHTIEGPDDMPAHVKAMLTATSLGIPVADGRMRLGAWQGLYLAEHRAAPHVRQVVLHYVGTLMTSDQSPVTPADRAR